MKKIIYIIYIILIVNFSIINVKAFYIDSDKINIDDKNIPLIETLDSKYKIEIDDFSNEMSINSDLYDLGLTLTKITLSNKDNQLKKEELTKYLYISAVDGFDTLTGSLAIDLYVQKINNNQINNDYIKDIKCVEFNDNESFIFVYLDDSKTSSGTKDVILGFWLKDDKLYYPWVTIETDLEEFYKTVMKKEDDGQIIGNAYNKIDINGSAPEISEELLTNIYNQGNSSVVQITGMSNNGIDTYGSGFYLNQGVVVTTWSLFKQLLTDSNFVYVNDANGNTYQIEGVIAVQTTLDVVILKLDTITGKPVQFASPKSLQANDAVFMINSKQNSGFSINYGTFIKEENGRFYNMLPLNTSDIGSCLFDKDGAVVAINMQDLTDSDLSIANSTEYLAKLQTILDKTKFDNIDSLDVNRFKDNYYLNIEEESTYNTINSKIWNKYNNIAYIDNIKLSLLKASYQDNILSLRYKSTKEQMIDDIYLINDYIATLEANNFQLTYQDKYKKIFSNNKYQLIIKDNLNYIIIIIRED